MRTHRLTVPIAAIAIALGSFSAQAQERAERRTPADQDQGRERPQSDDFARPRGGGGDRGSADRGNQRADPSAQPRDRQANRDGSYAPGNQRSRGRDSRGHGRDGTSAPRGRSDRGRSNDRYQSYGHGGGDNDNYDFRGGSGYGYGSYRRDRRGYRSYGYRGVYGYADGYAYSPYYYAPRPLPYRYAPRRYYGSGGHLSIYFGFGSGYLYGAPYSGRVYGYRAPASSWASERYYGDIRLQVNPPDAEVYVDGYYAGIVDDFDGQYQRLALEAGPHKIEIGGRGLRPQVFDIYVDPSRTVELWADLLR